MCRFLKWTSSIFLIIYFFHLLRQSLLLNPSSWIPASVTSHLTPGIPTSVASQLTPGILSLFSYRQPPQLPSFYVSSGDLNAGVHICSAGALPTEPAPQPFPHFFTHFSGAKVMHRPQLEGRKTLLCKDNIE